MICERMPYMKVKAQEGPQMVCPRYGETRKRHCLRVKLGREAHCPIFKPLVHA